MALVGKDSLLFGASGRIGDYVFCSDGKRTVMKNAPVRKPGGHDSERAKEQRLRFSFASQFVLKAASVFRLGFAALSGWNGKAMAAVMQAAYPLDKGQFAVDFSRLTISGGGLKVKTKPLFTIGECGLRFGWKCSDSKRYVQELVVVLYLHDLCRWQVYSGLKNDKSLLIPLPPASEGAALEYFFFFRDIQSGDCTASTYAGQILQKEGKSVFHTLHDKV